MNAILWVPVVYITIFSKRIFSMFDKFMWRWFQARDGNWNEIDLNMQLGVSIETMHTAWNELRRAVIEIVMQQRWNNGTRMPCAAIM